MIEKKVKFLQSISCQKYFSSIPMQVILINKLSNDPVGGIDALICFLIIRKQESNWIADYLDGLVYETLLKHTSSNIKHTIFKVFGHGIVTLKSQKNIDYLPLQNLLISKQFQEADILTHNKLCELSNFRKNTRSWLYFTDIFSLPSEDLQTIDKLWRIHSLNKFGFSVQRSIWLASNKDWNKFWTSIGWKINHVLCRYPNEFQWNTDGPLGHLPLFNQLYGVQPMLALFQHKAWEYL